MYFRGYRILQTSGRKIKFLRELIFMNGWTNKIASYVSSQFSSKNYYVTQVLVILWPPPILCPPVLCIDFSLALNHTRQENLTVKDCYCKILATKVNFNSKSTAQSNKIRINLVFSFFIVFFLLSLLSKHWCSISNPYCYQNPLCCYQLILSIKIQKWLRLST